MEHQKKALAVFGGGCFWCTEAVFQRIRGVTAVTPGYAGGSTENPTYEDVSYNETGHAEVVQVEFDPTVISYEELLDVFWHSHDPTTLNRQGADVGTQYRSIILYVDDSQPELAQESLNALAASGEYEAPIVTQIEPLQRFYTAEEYHKNYFNQNPRAPYCQVVIAPKVKKVLEKYGKIAKG
jgi:peptide-methionine (S)-S-oxide reductase